MRMNCWARCITFINAAPSPAGSLRCVGLGHCATMCARSIHARALWNEVCVADSSRRPIKQRARQHRSRARKLLPLDNLVQSAQPQTTIMCWVFTYWYACGHVHYVSRIPCPEVTAGKPCAFGDLHHPVTSEAGICLDCMTAENARWRHWAFLRGEANFGRGLDPGPWADRWPRYYQVPMASGR